MKQGFSKSTEENIQFSKIKFDQYLETQFKRKLCSFRNLDSMGMEYLEEYANILFEEYAFHLMNVDNLSINTNNKYLSGMKRYIKMQNPNTKAFDGDWYHNVRQKVEKEYRKRILEIENHSQSAFQEEVFESIYNALLDMKKTQCVTEAKVKIIDNAGSSITNQSETIFNKWFKEPLVQVRVDQLFIHWFTYDLHAYNPRVSEKTKEEMTRIGELCRTMWYCKRFLNHNTVIPMKPTIDQCSVDTYESQYHIWFLTICKLGNVVLTNLTNYITLHKYQSPDITHVRPPCLNIYAVLKFLNGVDYYCLPNPCVIDLISSEYNVISDDVMIQLATHRDHSKRKRLKPNFDNISMYDD